MISRVRVNTNNSKSNLHIVSVVIPTIERTTINLCKAALNRQTRPPDEILSSQTTSDGEPVGRVMRV